MLNDGLFVFDYIKNKLKIEKIGILGSSIGGLVACHIGRHRK